MLSNTTSYHKRFVWCGTWPDLDSSINITTLKYPQLLGDNCKIILFDYDLLSIFLKYIHVNG